MSTRPRRVPFRSWIVLAVLVAVLPGCAILNQFLQGLERPTASLVGVQLSSFSLTGVTVDFSVKIANPYVVDLPLVGADFSLASTGQPFLQGKADLQGTIPAKGEKVFSFPATIVFAEALRVLTSLRPGAVVPVQSTLGLLVNTQSLGTLRLPLTHEGQLGIPTIPDVSVVSVKWGAISLSGVSGSAVLRVANTNSFPLDLSTLDYGFRLGNFDIAKGGLTQAVAMSPGAAQDMTINLALSTAQAGLALLDLVRGSSSRYALAGALSVGTPFGPLRIPYNVGGDVPFLR